MTVPGWIHGADETALPLLCRSCHYTFSGRLSLVRGFRYSGAASLRVSMVSPVGGELCRMRP
jgi:hypothetical protein